MIMKTMTQNFRRMEEQTEKIQEIFNKDLEKTKEQTETNNNCIKNTLEGANCGIRAGGTRMEKIAEWRKTLPQNREQEKRTGSKRPLGKLEMHQPSHYKGPRRRRDRKDLRQYLKRE